MKNRTIILAAIAVLVLGFLLTGCTTQRKVVKYMNAHGYEAASYCALAFPVKDSTIYLPGKTVVTHHVDTIPGEVIPCPDHFVDANKKIYVHCPPSIHTHDTVIRHDTAYVIRENTAKTAAVTGQLAITTTRADKAENGLSKWRRWCLVTWGALALSIAAFAAAKFKIL